ncbi:MAG: 16S rRNA (adenine(1518)-N(6)/adenine(1519)-N(6))-dimethyltransferase RsmA [Methanobrevibacter sp.]|uniref:16S rRNA (adenine(1518)-N(6)/adenine(1519)-N(6))- dimethyltransferase RsmA n=1 Tax=Methanobrevibacter sp. TaxID=66852 RepID=UPI0026DEFA4E|nr:16S rRNA (adenine(1518)-N(6)/adenine(1519)-N(6))-dimethyltransferase RsmA [Methanobrevibacter sp.]MDO5848601.1 16S rRNA (adenine(1518)-N(6)/adenine(1519)-N(6))-dimethyltransferase RsmA [Methanobrevibacter sp.]
MSVSNIDSLAKQTKSILNKNNIKLNKNLGQNYLIDKNKRDQIIKFGNLTKDDVVLEIGPGIGTLTTELSAKAKKVIAIEQDPIIFKILEERLEKEKIDNVELINNDALNVDFPKFNKIVSNLPYQISSPITFKFLEYDFDSAILMYQKEFANRMDGKVGTKDYSRLSAMLYFKCDVEILTQVSAESFIPKPKVDSSVVKLTPKLPELIGKLNAIENDEISDPAFKTYSNFTKALFQHKNKKARNALIDSRHEVCNLDKKEMKKKLNSITSHKINDLLDQRVITITPEEILYLSEHLTF